MKKSIFKEILLCGLVSVVTFALFSLSGSIFGSIDNIMLLILDWIIIIMISYSLFIFIPFFGKKSERYIDFYPIISATILILIICLSRSKDFEDYRFVSFLIIISSIAATVELIVKPFSRIKDTAKNKEIIKGYEKIINNVKLAYREYARKIIIGYYDVDYFKVIDVARLLSLSKEEARDILKHLVEVNLISVEGNTNDRIYYINK